MIREEAEGPQTTSLMEHIVLDTLEDLLNFIVHFLGGTKWDVFVSLANPMSGRVGNLKKRTIFTVAL
jgi:hypothetical protein